jgi:hypothetical protein
MPAPLLRFPCGEVPHLLVTLWCRCEQACHRFHTSSEWTKGSPRSCRSLCQTMGLMSS